MRAEHYFPARESVCHGPNRCRRRALLRLTRDHVDQINKALAQLEIASPYGQVVLVVEKGRIAELEWTSSIKYHDLAAGSRPANDP